MFKASLVCQMSARYTKAQIRRLRETRNLQKLREEKEKALRNAYFPALEPTWHKRSSWKNLVKSLQQEQTQQ